VSCELHIAVLQDNVTPSFLHPAYEVRPSRRRDDIPQRPARRPEPASHSPLSRVEYFLRSGRISPPPSFPPPDRYPHQQAFGPAGGGSRTARCASLLGERLPRVTITASNDYREQ
jgi:hypothetical protein